MLAERPRHTFRATGITACENMGMGQDEVLGRSIWDLYPDTIGTRFETELCRAVAEQKSSSFEYFYMGAEMCDIKPGNVIAVWGCGPVR